MPEKINENIFKDEIEPLGNIPSADFEFSKTPETKELVNDIDALVDAINYDGTVKSNDLEKIVKNLGGVKVEFGGERFTFEELKNIPDIKENVKIWKEVECGNFKNIYKLTYLIPRIVERLSRHQGDLDLDGLIAISDTCAEHLSQHRGDLYLSGLTTISDTIANHLSTHQGDVNLNGLAVISDTCAKYLAQIQGTLYLDGLTVISEVSAEHLSKHQGELCLDELATISDTMAEHLSKHRGGLLWLNGLTTISDIGAKHLSKHSNLIVNDKIKEIIEKYK